MYGDAILAWSAPRPLLANVIFRTGQNHLAYRIDMLQTDDNLPDGLNGLGSVMKRYLQRYLPGRNEIILFATLAMVCALVAWWLPSHDAALSMMAFPLFVFCSILGLAKNGRLRAGDEE
jgi:hypothetical protein